MILPDFMIRDLAYLGLISPFTLDQLQPASYDFRLGERFLITDPQAEYIDPRGVTPGRTIEVKIAEGEFFVLHPGEFALAFTQEFFRFPPDLSGQLGGKSSLGRLGIQVHATAGFMDPGFCGQATLELSNVARLPIRLYPGMLIGQMLFMQMAGLAERPYGSPGLDSKYQGQTGPTMSMQQKRFA